MPRVAKAAYLYLDPGRKTWSIRAGSNTYRTGCIEEDHASAQWALDKFMKRKRARLNRAIYFVTCDLDDFPIKIGMSGDLDERMRDIRTSLPFNVILLGSFLGTSADEAAIQNRFAEYRIRGEWFRRCHELMALISSFSNCSRAVTAPPSPSAGVQIELSP